MELYVIVVETEIRLIDSLPRLPYMRSRSSFLLFVIYRPEIDGITI